MNYDVIRLLSAVPGGRVFGLDQQTLISTLIQLLNACILAVVLGIILYKPVREFMKKRSEKIGGQLEGARAKMAEADKVKAEYEKKLSEIESERALILEAAKAEAAEGAKHVIAQARSEASAIKQRAEESVRTERERLKKETKHHIVEVSALMTEKLISRTADGIVQEELFNQALSELENATWRS